MKDLPVISLLARDHHSKTVNNLREAQARGKLIIIADEGAENNIEFAHKIFRCHFYTMPFPNNLLNTYQLLAYHTAIAKGTDVDQPRI